MLGMGGHAHSVVDSIEQTEKYRVIGFLDEQERKGKSYREYPVLDTDDAMKRYFDSGVKNAFVTVGYLGHGHVRERLYQQLKDIGYSLPNIIDSTAIVSENAKLGEGIFIGKNAVVNADAEIGNMCIVNTGAVIDHDCVVEEFSHIAVGSVLCGNVHIGRASLVGANAVVIQEKKIGNYCIVAAGTVVRKDMGNDCMNWSGKYRKIKRGGGKLVLRKGCAA